MKRNNPIILKARVGSNEVVRLRPEATRLVKELQTETGMSASSIVSQIVCQAVTLVGVEIRFDTEDDDED